MERQTALITGASSGIGLDFAHLFAQDGHDVVLVARRGDKLRNLAADLEAAHKITAHVEVADLSDPAAVEALARRYVDKSINIDFLINNAGFGTSGKFVETDLKAELEMIQVNIAALTQLTKLFLPPMLARGKGRVINVASTAAFQPGPLMAVYYATKAYVLSFSDAIAEELSGTGVTVTTLCPGPTATAFAAAADMTERRLFKIKKPMTSMDVARAGYRAMHRGKRLVVTGASNKILAQAVRITPRRLAAKVTRALQERA